MKYIDICERPSWNLKERNGVAEIEKFISGHTCKDGKIIVLYGLQCTGKATMLEQIIHRYNKQVGCAFWEVEDNDSMDDVYRMIIDEQAKGTAIICINEITKAQDFITNSSVLADIFAKEEVNIIATGTDSLGFAFADRNELYDRTVYIKSTYISFAEHCRVLGTNDIEDYIMFGGLMRRGSDKASVHDYESACKYLNCSVSENILRSIKNSQEDSCLNILSQEELSCLIGKMVGLYSGIFAARRLEHYSFNRKSINPEFLKALNAGHAINGIITDKMVKKLQNYLIDIDVLSAITAIDFVHDELLGWQEKGQRKEFYLIQPAIKYYHLLEKLKSTMNGEYGTLADMIKADMLEQIVSFDTAAALAGKRYFVAKPNFISTAWPSDNHGMLVYDIKDNRHWLLVITYADVPNELPAKPVKLEVKFGQQEKPCILYRGKSFIDSKGMKFLNVARFLCAIHRIGNIEKAIDCCMQQY